MGENGRGFAIVADEVRKLAERTLAATVQISDLVHAIRVDSQIASQHIGNLAQVSRDHGARGKQVTEEIDCVLGLSRDLQQTISAGALRGFAEVAKFDHLVFKLRIYLAAFGRQNKEPSAVASHKVCRLGKRYSEGDGRACFSQFPGFVKVESPHVAVHANAKRAIACAQAGDSSSAV